MIRDLDSNRAIGTWIVALAFIVLALTRVGLWETGAALAIAVVLIAGTVIAIRTTDAYRHRREDEGYFLAFPAARVPSPEALLRGRVQATERSLRWVSTEVRPITEASEQVSIPLTAIEAIIVRPSRFHLTAVVDIAAAEGVGLTLRSGMSPGGTRRRLTRLRESVPGTTFSVE